MLLRLSKSIFTQYHAIGTNFLIDKFYTAHSTITLFKPNESDNSYETILTASFAFRTFSPTPQEIQPSKA